MSNNRYSWSKENILSIYLNDFTSQKKYAQLYKIDLWLLTEEYFAIFESTCGFVNVKLVIVDLLGGYSNFSVGLLHCKIWIAFTLMASESYYHPIRECGILVILLLFPLGSDYNREGQG